jgi:hypothetical protein
MAVQGIDQVRGAVTAAIGNEEGAPALSFADVARKVAGGDAPPWLSTTLERWGPSLSLDRGVVYKQPTRSQMRKNLQGARDAAMLVVSALNDGATRDFLNAASGGTISYHGQIDHLLHVSIGRVRIEPAKAALERIVDQEPKSWGDRLNGWRHHFKQAKKPATTTIRQEFRRHLNEDKNWAGFVAGETPD